MSETVVKITREKIKSTYSERRKVFFRDKAVQISCIVWLIIMIIYLILLIK